MENSDTNVWTENNIFTHEFEESAAEIILETNHNQTIADSNDDCDKFDIKTSTYMRGSGNAKIGIKIPKLERTNKSYVFQCQEDMTQDFIDYLKEMSSTNSAANDKGEFLNINASRRHVKNYFLYYFLLSRAIGPIFFFLNPKLIHVSHFCCTSVLNSTLF